MQARAKVTSKGQVTIPVEVRRALGIAEGDLVVFEVGEQYATLSKPRSVVELAAEWRAEHPLPEPRFASEREAVAEHVRAHYLAKEARRGPLAIASRDGVRYLGEAPAEDAEDD